MSNVSFRSRRVEGDQKTSRLDLLPAPENRVTRLEAASGAAITNLEAEVSEASLLGCQTVQDTGGEERLTSRRPDGPAARREPAEPITPQFSEPLAEEKEPSVNPHRSLGAAAANDDFAAGEEMGGEEEDQEMRSDRYERKEAAGREIDEIVEGEGIDRTDARNVPLGYISSMLDNWYAGAPIEEVKERVGSIIEKSGLPEKDRFREKVFSVIDSLEKESETQAATQAREPGGRPETAVNDNVSQAGELSPEEQTVINRAVQGLQAAGLSQDVEIGETSGGKTRVSFRGGSVEATVLIDTQTGAITSGGEPIDPAFQGLGRALLDRFQDSSLVGRSHPVTETEAGAFAQFTQLLTGALERGEIGDPLVAVSARDFLKRYQGADLQELKPEDLTRASLIFADIMASPRGAKEVSEPSAEPDATAAEDTPLSQEPVAAADGGHPADKFTLNINDRSGEPEVMVKGKPLKPADRYRLGLCQDYRDRLALGEDLLTEEQLQDLAEAEKLFKESTGIHPRAILNRLKELKEAGAPAAAQAGPTQWRSGQLVEDRFGVVGAFMGITKGPEGGAMAEIRTAETGPQGIVPSTRYIPLGRLADWYRASKSEPVEPTDPDFLENLAGHTQVRGWALRLHEAAGYARERRFYGKALAHGEEITGDRLDELAGLSGLHFAPGVKERLVQELVAGYRSGPVGLLFRSETTHPRAQDRLSREQEIEAGPFGRGFVPPKGSEEVYTTPNFREAFTYPEFRGDPKQTRPIRFIYALDARVLEDRIGEVGVEPDGLTFREIPKEYILWAVRVDRRGRVTDFYPKTRQ